MAGENWSWAFGAPFVCRCQIIISKLTVPSADESGMWRPLHLPEEAMERDSLLAGRSREDGDHANVFACIHKESQVAAGRV